MPLHPQKFREIVFQVLYSKDMAEVSEEGLIRIFSKELAVTKKSIKLAIDRSHKIREKLPELDESIRQACVSYDFERIRSVERNILRLGVFEILLDDAIPPKVAISEAIRLANKFATPEAATFVNAVLDTIYKKSKGESTDPQHLTAALEELETASNGLPPVGNEIRELRIFESEDED